MGTKTFLIAVFIHRRHFFHRNKSRVIANCYYKKKRNKGDVKNSGRAAGRGCQANRGFRFRLKHPIR